MRIPNARQYDVTPNRAERRTYPHNDTREGQDTAHATPQQQGDMLVFAVGALVGAAATFYGILYLLED